MSLYVLNPLAHGYAGLVLRLAEEYYSTVTSEMLDPTHVLARSALTRSIADRVEILLAS